MSERKSFDDIAALVAERRKFEEWIRALEAKREKTAPHVFSRVHADYEERLRGVTERLASHQGALGAERLALEERRAEVEAQIQKTQDERAELELRGHVGELETAALAEGFKASDAVLDALAVNRSGIEADLARITEFVGASEAKSTAATPVVASTPEPPAPKAAASPAASEPVPAVEPEPAPPATRLSMVAETAVEPPPIVAPSSPAPQRKSRASFDELGFLQSVIGGPDDLRQTSAPISATPEVERESPKLAPFKARPSVKTADRPADKQIEKAADQSSANATAKPAEKTGERSARQSIAAHQVSMTIEPQSSPRNSGIVKAEALPSLLDGIVSSADTGEKPYAANVGSNTPLSLKGQAGETKTLKCRECGAMNDPTEWYCERCGAELSAM